jgi:hypothetical protein
VVKVDSNFVNPTFFIINSSLNKGFWPIFGDIREMFYKKDTEDNLLTSLKLIQNISF